MNNVYGGLKSYFLSSTYIEAMYRKKDKNLNSTPNIVKPFVPQGGHSDKIFLYYMIDADWTGLQLNDKIKFDVNDLSSDHITTQTVLNTIIDYIDEHDGTTTSYIMDNFKGELEDDYKTSTYNDETYLELKAGDEYDIAFGKLEKRVIDTDKLLNAFINKSNYKQIGGSIKTGLFTAGSKEYNEVVTINPLNYVATFNFDKVIQKYTYNSSSNLTVTNTLLDTTQQYVYVYYNINNADSDNKINASYANTKIDYSLSVTGTERDGLINLNDLTFSYADKKLSSNVAFTFNTTKFYIIRSQRKDLFDRGDTTYKTGPGCGLPKLKSDVGPEDYNIIKYDNWTTNNTIVSMEKIGENTETTELGTYNNYYLYAIHPYSTIKFKFYSANSTTFNEGHSIGTDSFNYTNYYVNNNTQKKYTVVQTTISLAGFQNYRYAKECSG